MPQSSTQSSESLQLAVIPGDGIGTEVITEALKVLEAVTPTGVKFEPTRYDLGAQRYLATGEVLPDSVLEEIRQHDVILLGAVGGKPNDPNLPPGILERGLLLRLRFELDHYVNLRPSRIYPGATSPLAEPGEVDFVVVREGTEGPYTGNGGALRVGTPHEIATEVSVNTAFGVERVVRDAFRRASEASRQAHPGPQDQRAGERGCGVVAAGAAGRCRVPRRHGRLHAHRRGDDLHGHRPGPLRRDRDRQPVRRHHHRPRGSHHRRNRAGGQRQRQPRPDGSVDVRARPRLGPRHRRTAGRRPHRGDPLGGPAARAPRPRRGSPERRGGRRRRPGRPSGRPARLHRGDRRLDRRAPEQPEPSPRRRRPSCRDSVLP